MGALIARTAGRDPEPDLVAEVHRRTGGNPFFVEQTARLWGADGDLTAIAPGVRDVVRRRLSQLPEAVRRAAGDRGRARSGIPSPGAGGRFAGAPVAEVDRLLDRAVVARLVTARGGGQFAFAHDLVRETLYDGLDEAERRRRHAAVIRAVDRRGAGRAPPSRPNWPATRTSPAPSSSRRSVVDRLLTAARDASARLATDEAIVHYRRALEVVDDPARRARITLELGRGAAPRRRSCDRVAALRRRGGTGARARRSGSACPGGAERLPPRRQRRAARARTSDDLVREAHKRLVGATAAIDRDRLVLGSDRGTEASARRGRNDDALTFSLWTRHDTMWGPGTAGETRGAHGRDWGRSRGARTTGTAELFAASLRWVALVEQGDPRYYDQFQTFVALAERTAAPRWRMGAIRRPPASSPPSAGSFARPSDKLAETDEFGDHGHSEFAFMGQHLRWALLMLQGRFAEAEDLLRPMETRDHPSPWPAARHHGGGTGRSRAGSASPGRGRGERHAVRASS